MDVEQSTDFMQKHLQYFLGGRTVSLAALETIEL